MDKMNVGKQGVDLCSSSVTQCFVAAYFEQTRWQDYLATLCQLYRRRRDTMLDALAESFPAESTWTQPRGRAVPVGHRALRARHDRPAGARAAGARRVRPGPRGVPRRPRRVVDAAELLGRRRRRHPRGRAAIGEVVREQVELYGTLTGSTPPAVERRATPRTAPDEQNVVPLQRRARG
jgi:2-aminoadipate transaminase